MSCIAAANDDDDDVDALENPPLSSLIAGSSVARNACFDLKRRSFLQAMLRYDWRHATKDLDIPIALRDSWFDRLWQLHTESSRHYHTAVHLEEMLHYLTTLRDAQYISTITAIDENAIVLSIFFHDAIYNPRSATNEQDSAELFRAFADDAGIAKSQQHGQLVANVEQFILATKKHVVSSDNSFSLALFLDLDMAVLGKQDAAYRAYAALIRKEYSFVDRDEYCTKRAQVLEQFLTQDRIFGTPVMTEAMEEQARRNLRLEIEALKRGVIYGESA